jgi:fumarate reductase subunit D
MLSTITIFEKHQTTECLFFLVIVLCKSNHSEVWHLFAQGKGWYALFSLVVYLIMDIANFWLPIITLIGVVHDLFGKCLIITLYLFSLLKKLG